MRFLTTLSILLSLCFELPPVALASEDINLLVDWIKANGGIFNKKQELRYGEGDESFLFGVFATRPIKQDEILALLPWKLVVSAGMGKKRFENCDFVQLIKDQMEEGENAYHAIYMETLKETVQQHASLLPAYWTPDAQALFRNVTNDTLPPLAPFMEEFEWKHECQQISEEGTLLVLTHSEDWGLAPLVDRYNSRGYPYTNAYFSSDGDPRSQVAVEVRALRDIAAGEQIYTDYRDYNSGQIGTPELLRDYGFVEMYPQRWIFHEQRFAFDVNQTHDGRDVEANWLARIDRVKYRKPDSEVIEFLHRELVRLTDTVYPDLRRRLKQNKEEGANQDIPRATLETIVRYCKDVMTAMTSAIKSACKQDGVCVDKSSETMEHQEVL